MIDPAGRLYRDGGAMRGARLSLDWALSAARRIELSGTVLLYTGSAPEIVNDTTMRARLSDRCVPGDAYLVNLRTGRPVRER